jgi:hypothetical protein
MEPQPYLDSVTFQPWSHKLKPEVRVNQATHLHTHSHQKLLQFSFALLGEVPDLWNSFWRFPGVDQTPLPPSGPGPD